MTQFSPRSLPALRAHRLIFDFAFRCRGFAQFLLNLSQCHRPALLRVDESLLGGRPITIPTTANARTKLSPAAFSSAATVSCCVMVHLQSTKPHKHRPVTAVMREGMSSVHVPSPSTAGSPPGLPFLGGLGELRKCGHHFCRHVENHRSPDRREGTLWDQQDPYAQAERGVRHHAKTMGSTILIEHNIGNFANPRTVSGEDRRADELGDHFGGFEINLARSLRLG